MILVKVLLAGPDHAHGSLPPYLDVLAHHLRDLGAHVDRLGSTGVPYDPEAGRFHRVEQITATVDALAARVDPGRYDLVSLHFGNLEVEQLLPARWRALGLDLPPVVVHVHALEPTLFTRHVPDPGLHAAAQEAIDQAAGLVYFGQYARTILTRRAPAAARLPHAVVPLPTTISPGTQPATTYRMAAALHDPRPEATLLSLCGYAAPWKNPADLITALAATTAPVRVVLAGPFWDDPTQAGCDLHPAIEQPQRLGRAAELAVVPDYLDAPHRAALIAASTGGVFPYQPQSTFQGSGAIADYLAHGLPVIATDVANMAELAGPAGIIIPAGDPAALAAAIDRFATDIQQRQRLRIAAHQQAARFTPTAHATACLAFYQRVAGG